MLYNFFFVFATRQKVQDILLAHPQLNFTSVFSFFTGTIYMVGEPNDGFLLNTLGYLDYFWISRVAFKAAL